MNIGIVDVDGLTLKKKFPNIALMKISAWHKSRGDSVEWANPLFGQYDVVYQSKVFSFTPDDLSQYNAKRIVKGGTGYAIRMENGKEIFDKSKDVQLDDEIEHIYPDYSIYPELTKDTAFGFLTRGCPRGCDFCHVAAKEGRCSVKVANLDEFWRGQKNIVLCDPNILACRDWRELLNQLIDSKAYVDFNQGLDARLMTDEKAQLMAKIRIKEVHFAWDRCQDRDKVLKGLETFSRYSRKLHSHWGNVFTLTNFDTTFEQDIERIETLREMGYWAYVMIYDKEHCDPKYRKLQRWVNNRFVFAKCKTFNDYELK